MRNPLNKRILRELKEDIGKYAALFLFLAVTIGFVSGQNVACSSMKTSYNEGFAKYNIEDGHFTLLNKADKSLINDLEDKNIKIEKMFYKEENTKNDNTYRFYKLRNDVNKITVLSGELPKSDGEIAIDRLYAVNNKIKVGDTVTVGANDYKVSGYCSFPDYTALFKNNTDMMFDAKKFTVALVTDKQFDSLSNSSLKYCYSWTDNNKNLTDKEKGDLADNITKTITKKAFLTDLVNQHDNQAITFAGNDLTNDKSMMSMLLYIVMVIIAFVFAVTLKSTIEKEAGVIGTLRASGYKKREILIHYIELPLIVTFAAAVAGNILGYTVFKDLIAKLYYNSYSFGTYKTFWNADAFLKTTVVPCIIILVINLIVLIRMLSFSPLSFMRKELNARKKKRAVKLPNFKFLTRFRIRIILQNLPAYLTLFIGIILASILLMYGLLFNPLLKDYKKDVLNSEISKYQYILKAPVKTDNSGAEKYSVTSLDNSNNEKITVYGIEENSKYLKNIDVTCGAVVSDGYMEKYGVKVGDTLKLRDKFADKDYSFKITGSVHYPAALAVFTDKFDFNKKFDLESGYFNGYFSESRLTDIDEKYIASTITQNDLTLVADQLDRSIGDVMLLIKGFAVLLYILLMFLLAKIIVEKNEQSISMTKILGYSDKEVGKLYNTSTGIVVLISLLLSLPISYYTIFAIYHLIMQTFTGWISYKIEPFVYPEMLAIGVVCYGVVHFIQMRRIKKIPMSQALKNME